MEWFCERCGQSVDLEELAENCKPYENLCLECYDEITRGFDLDEYGTEAPEYGKR